MNDFWKPILSKVLAIVACSMLLGYGLDAALGWAVAALSFGVWLWSWARNAARIWRWSEDFSLQKIPLNSGWWEDLVTRIYRLQKNRQQQQQQHQAETAELRNILQALPEGILTLNQDYEILWCDAMAAEHLGLDAQRDIGLPIMNLVRYPDFVAYLQHVQHDASGAVEDQVLKMPAPQTGRGVPRTLSIRLVRYGQAQRLLLTRDISHWEKIETMRRDFIANVSHELKTPLTVVGGFLEVLREHALAPEQQNHYLHLMTEQAQRMQRLVEDLLTLSTLESSEARAGDDLVSMTALLAQLENDAQALSQGRHHLRFVAQPGLDVRGNEQELLSAFGNLISNAIRYTPDGGAVSVHWVGQTMSELTAESTAELTAEPAMVEAVFSVTDAGIGIEPQHLPRLTERFYRVDHSRSRASGGTGLGLAIVKHVLLHHQAHLEIKSTPGQGSTFSIKFPAERCVLQGHLEKMAHAGGA